MTTERRPMAGRWWLGVLAVLVAVGLAAGCSSTTNTDGGGQAATGAGNASQSDPVADEGTPVDGGKLVFGINNDSAGWNPHVNQWAQHSSVVGSSMLEPLAALDGDLNPVPWLATSWTPNDTFDSWTVELRDDVTFSDGTAFDAEA